jgi:hypothetical protein
MPSAIAADFQAGTREANYSDNTRTGLEADAIARALIDNLHCLQARRPQDATRNGLVHGSRLYRARPNDASLHKYPGLDCGNEHRRQNRCVSADDLHAS